MEVAVLTSVEVREAVERAERRFVDVCVGATDKDWCFEPAGSGQDAWKMPEVVEHVTDANHGVLGLLRDVVVKSPRGDLRRDFDDDDMPYLFYGGAGPAGQGLAEPSGTVTDREESIAAFRASMRALLDWYDNVDVDLRECAAKHPAFGIFDGAQWLLFAAAHVQQHRGQLLDLRLASERASSTAVVTP
jgi:hypothetical protein